MPHDKKTNEGRVADELIAALKKHDSNIRRVRSFDCDDGSVSVIVRSPSWGQVAIQIWSGR